MRLALLLVLALFVPAGLAASANDAAPQIVAAPGGWLTQYATPLIVTTSPLGLRFHNEDIMRHDVVADEYGPDGQPWCLDTPTGRCPLFWTELVGRGVTVDVQGIENAEPVIEHGFFCTLHTAMRGTLVIAPS